MRSRQLRTPSRQREIAGQIAAAMASENESDSSGSDFEDVQISEKDMTALVELEQQLESNPASYDTHLQVHLSRFRCPSSGR